MDETRIPAEAPEGEPPMVAQDTPPKRRPNYFWVALVLGGILSALCLSVSAHAFALAATLTLGALVLAGSPPKALPVNIIGVCIFGMLLFWAMPNINRSGYDGVKNAEVKQNVHAIQLALERYATEHDCYPASISAMLVDPSSKMELLPRNPFRSTHYQSASMKPYNPNAMLPLNELGWPVQEPLEGNFQYLPDRELVDGQLMVTGYRLVAFGVVTQSKLAHWLYPMPGARLLFVLDGGKRYEAERRAKLLTELSSCTNETEGNGHATETR